MTDIDVVLFDMGRVLVTIDFDAFPNALGLRTPEQRAPYRDRAMKLEILYECGTISTAEFLRKQREVFGGRFSEQQILEAYNAIIVEENSSMVPLVQEVKRHRRIAVLSNTSEEHWKRSLAIAPVLASFTDRYTSFHLGAMKPSAVVYEKVIASLSVPASSIVFIDDVRENVDAAVRCGMQGIVFTDADQTRVALRELNVL